MNVSLLFYADCMDVPFARPHEIPEDAPLIDVRELNEWNAGHAPNAQHLPASTLLEHLDQLPEDEVYVVCRTGGRSFQVSQWLNANGFEAINVEGGMKAWAHAGLPLTAEGEQPPEVL